ncbi:MAG: nucleoside recognition domain-containing protein [Dorea sp.]
MKNHFFQFFLILCFFVMLLFPSEVFEGAKSGLLLWFLTVLPTLFPFLLISRLLLDSCACSLLNKLLAPAISRLFGISAQGSFAFIVGFLCGYPMGAKITADLFHARQISKAEAFLSTVILQ